MKAFKCDGCGKYQDGNPRESRILYINGSYCNYELILKKSCGCFNEKYERCDNCFKKIIKKILDSF